LVSTQVKILCGLVSTHKNSQWPDLHTSQNSQWPDLHAS
jgi:hypothetical protein